jgi:hypothetical protein
MSHLQQDTGNASARTSNFCLSSVCCTIDKTTGTTESDSHRPRRAIIPTAKLTNASNSSKPALKSHQAVADAQRAAEAQKAAELKAIQQAAEEVNTQCGIGWPSRHVRDLTIPVEFPTSAQSITPPSDDDLEEIVGRAKGKRKAISTRPNLKFTLVNH